VWLPTAQCFRPSSTRFLLCFLADFPWLYPFGVAKEQPFSAVSECVCTLDLLLGITASLFPFIAQRSTTLQVPYTSLYTALCGSLHHHHPSLPNRFLAAQLCAVLYSVTAALSRILPHSAALCRIGPLSAALCRSLPLSAAPCSSSPLSAAFHRIPPHSVALCRALSVAAPLSPCAPSIVSQC
jgi:hypothetical protein